MIQDEDLVILITEIPDLDQAVDCVKEYTEEFPNNAYSLRFDVKTGGWSLVRPRQYDEF